MTISLQTVSLLADDFFDIVDLDRFFRIGGNLGAMFRAWLARCFNTPFMSWLEQHGCLSVASSFWELSSKTCRIYRSMTRKSWSGSWVGDHSQRQVKLLSWSVKQKFGMVVCQTLWRFFIYFWVLLEKISVGV